MSGRKKSSEVIRADQFIGRKIYELRNTKQWPCRELANAIGITYQQLKKYEAGIDGVSIGRLALIANLLGYATEFLLKGIDQHLGYRVSSLKGSNADDPAGSDMRYQGTNIQDLSLKKKCA